MPVYRLNKDLIFPEPDKASDIGLLAIGGDLSIERLLLAYSKGIFPWFSRDEPILWWSPDPRAVLFPGNLKVSKSLRQTLRNKLYEVKFDTDFESIIEQCSVIKRKGEKGTWITDEMKNAYIVLHKAGYAHSVETYYDGRLSGGLYGVSLGHIFFGESMFSIERDASKIALYFLTEKVKKWDFRMIDAQVETSHLLSLGAENIPRIEYLNMLSRELTFPTIKGKW